MDLILMQLLTKIIMYQYRHIKYWENMQDLGHLILDLRVIFG
jgi:hypothetical protein